MMFHPTLDVSSIKHTSSECDSSIARSTASYMLY